MSSSASTQVLRGVEYAKQLIGRFHGRAKHAEEVRKRHGGSLLPSQTIDAEPAEGVRGVLAHLSLARYANRLLGAGIVVGLLTWVIVFVSVMIAAAKPEQMQRALPSLPDAVRDHLGSEVVEDYSRVVLFARTVMEGLNTIDDAEIPVRQYLQPLMTPEVWQAKANERLKLASRYRRYKITQSCVVRGVRILADNEAAKERRIRVYVSGYITLLVLEGGKDVKPRTIPWRASMLLDVSRPTRVNPFEFYVVNLTEKFGPTAVAWDQEQRNLN